MTGKNQQPQFESFLVRIWHEPASRSWGGEVIHMSSRTSSNFATLEQAITFIRQYVPEILPNRPSPDDAGTDGEGVEKP